METKVKRGFFGSDLKIIAIVAMFIDHFAAAFLQNYYLKQLPPELYSFTPAEQTAWMQAHLSVAAISVLVGVMRCIGRFGFPIFAFLLVEGFIHTRDAKKYALRLGIFALISELPFNLAFSNVLFYPHYQNVFFTLTISIVALIFIKYFEDKDLGGCKPLCAVLGIVGMITTGAFLFRKCVFSAVLNFTHIKALDYVLPLCVGVILAFIIIAATKDKDCNTKNTINMTMFVLAVAIVLAEGLLTDYSGWGVFTVFVMYILRNKKTLAFSAGCAALTVMSPIEAFAFLMVPVVNKYNGKRGISLKYFFYAFYPVHLGLIYLAAYLMGYAYFLWH